MHEKMISLQLFDFIRTILMFFLILEGVNAFFCFAAEE